MTLEGIIDGIVAFQNQINKVVAGILENYEAEICDLNSEDQLFDRGVNADDAFIAYYQPYAPATIKIKRMEGMPYQRVTLKDTGDFYRGFRCIFGPDSFYIESTDEKSDFLAYKYSNEPNKSDIFGLDNKNKGLVAQEYLYPDLLEKFKECLK